MSNWILDPTTLPGFKRVKPVPLRKTIVQGIDSGKEARVGKWLTQRWRYDVELEMLRSSASFLEWQQVLTLFTRHAGRQGNFLFKVPDDNVVTDHGFGVGDGTTTAFQLQRTPGGSFSDGLGTWPTYTTPRKNRITYSQAFDNAAWTKVNLTATPAASIAPDGTLTACALNEGVATGVHTLNQNTTPAEVNGEIRSYSVFAHPDSGRYFYLGVATTGQRANVDLVAGTAVAANGATSAGITPLLGGWFLVTMSYTANGTGSGPIVAMTDASFNPSYTGTSKKILLWGLQAEVSYPATRYIPTTTAAVQQNPAYWPLADDGFEPVTEPIFSTVTVYKDGVAQSWSPGAGGIVTLTSVPAASSVLTWTGSYLRRVRMNNDEPDFDWILPGYYRSTIELISVV